MIAAATIEGVGGRWWVLTPSDLSKFDTLPEAQAHLEARGWRPASIGLAGYFWTRDVPPAAFDRFHLTACNLKAARDEVEACRRRTPEGSSEASELLKALDEEVEAYRKHKEAGALLDAALETPSKAA